MSTIARVSTIDEAVALAEQLRTAGRYDLFRGQRNSWGVASSIGRLDQDEQEEAGEQLDRLYNWIWLTPGLDAYRGEIAMLAVAQHFGLKSPLIDFSTDPSVAGFFCADGRAAGDRPVLICVNRADFLKRTRKLAEHWPDMADVILGMSFVQPPTPNLWRMEAQACVFLLATVVGDIERSLFPFDRIEIDGPVTQPHIPRENIYPTRKSDLERLLDQYFSIEHRRPGWELLTQLIPKEHSFRIEPAGDFFLKPAAIAHTSWRLGEKALWLGGVIPAEVLPAAGAFQFKLDQQSDPSVCARNLAALFEEGLATGLLDRGRLETFQCATRHRLREPEEGETGLATRVETCLAQLWDGMRRLPFTNAQIAESLARLVSIRLCPNGEEVLISDSIEVEFGAGDGAYSRSIGAADRITAAIRPDLEEVVKSEFFGRIDNPRLALLWIPDPQMLFTFEGFLDLWVSDILPAQMWRSTRGRSSFFSPWRLEGFGLR